MKHMLVTPLALLLTLALTGCDSPSQTGGPRLRTTATKKKQPAVSKPVKKPAPVVTAKPAVKPAALAKAKPAEPAPAPAATPASAPAATPASVPASAPASGPAGDDIAAQRSEMVRQYRQLQQEFVKAVTAQRWDDALAAAVKQEELAPQVPFPYLNQAVVLLQQGKTDPALAALEQSVRHGLDGRVLQSTDLVALKDNQKYKKLQELAASRAQEAAKLQAGLPSLFRTKEYAKAQEATARLIELQPSNDGHYYNHACAQALLGNADEAIRSLRQSVANGYTNATAMLADRDLQTLHGRADFKRLAEQVRKAEKEAFAETYQPGKEIEGVKTLEGHPDGGLRWRLRMSPKATKSNPNRLVIWLHPSGGSMNDRVEAMSADFVKRGYALLVLTQKDYRFWIQADGEKLFGPTISDVSKVEGIDVRKPILMGFSAGGQMALLMWSQKPGQLGGLVLDAAYPIDQSNGGALALPKDEAFKQVPIFVVVGGNDRGLDLWAKTAKPWREAGVPLVIRSVPNQGHTWLFDADMTQRLMDWLEQVGAGKLPTTTAPAK